jgi:hypothetical protein
MELRFTPVALSRAERFPLNEVMEWVIAASQAAAVEYGMVVRLIPSVNRHESPELAEQVAWLAAARQESGVVGIDLQEMRRSFRRSHSAISGRLIRPTAHLSTPGVGPAASTARHRNVGRRTHRSRCPFP